MKNYKKNFKATHSVAAMQSIAVIIRIALAAGIIFSMYACDTEGGNTDLTGSISISPSSGVTTGTELTATYTGTETVTFQWKRGETNVGAKSNKYTPDEAGSYTVTVSAAGFKSKTSAAVAVTGSAPPSSGIATLVLSGQVYLENWASDDSCVTYSNYTGADFLIDDYGLGGSGSVTGGNLNYSIGTPSSTWTFDKQEFEDNYFYDYNNINLSKASVEGNWLYLETDDPSGAELRKVSTSINISGNSLTVTDDYVRYFYVDNDITITGTGGTYGPDTYTNGGVTYTETYVNNNFSLELKTGWNIIYYKSEQSGTFTGTWDNLTSVTYTVTETISLSNPSIMWVLIGYIPPAAIPPAASTQLSFDTWANGSITSPATEQYFRFTATANEHFIHFSPGTLDDVWVEVYTSSGALVGRENLYDGNFTESWYLTSGQTYYIRVLPYYSSGSGTYQIAFNSSSIEPASGIIGPSPSIMTPKKGGTETPVKENQESGKIDPMVRIKKIR